MLNWAICILEVIIVLLAVKVVWQICSLRNRGNLVSNPVLGAVIGNAANINFENSQLALGGSSNHYGYMTSKNQNEPNILNRARGLMSAPESMAYRGGSL